MAGPYVPFGRFTRFCAVNRRLIAIECGPQIVESRRPSFVTIQPHGTRCGESSGCQVSIAHRLAQ